MISKELLSEVLGIPLTDFKYGNGLIAYTTYELPTFKYKEINIYELAHKCKEWASELEFEISSCSYKAIIEYNYRQEEDDDRRLFWKFDYETFTADAEPEAVFKACQWVLENKDKQ